MEGTEQPPKEPSLGYSQTSACPIRHVITFVHVGLMFTDDPPGGEEMAFPPSVRVKTQTLIQSCHPVYSLLPCSAGAEETALAL